MCLTDKDEGHFFGIGDWGGDSAGNTWYNPGKYEDRGCEYHAGPDDTAQRYVARQMKAQATLLSSQGLEVDFVLNSGDNFYPGGIDSGCSSEHQHKTDPTGQISEIFTGVYFNTALSKVPWLSVLGNHDYGGMGWSNGWDAQVFHTWESKHHVWRMPAPFWSQRIEYNGFSVEVFNLDSNNNDAYGPGEDPHHNICQAYRPSDSGSCHGMDLGNCRDTLNKLWRDGLEMLERGLSKENRATWTIVNTHFPVTWFYMDDKLQELHEKYGIDLMFTGHTHQQETGYKHNYTYIISGGGGGVTSDACPSYHGNDDAYGFVDFRINATTLSWDMHSHGGTKGEFPQVIEACGLTKGEAQATCAKVKSGSVQA